MKNPRSEKKINKYQVARVPAFTLTEVIIVMAVSSIIISAAVVFIVVVSNMAEGVLADYRFTSSAVTAISTLENEFLRAETVMQTDDGSLILLLPDGSETRLMIMPGTGIVFAGRRNDTLNVEISDWSVTGTGSSGDLVTGLNIVLLDGKRELPINVTRTYLRTTEFNSQIYEDRYQKDTY
ncbi:MAG: prepilin-type N-terminal cleavage/methylation domain-containing protein [Bacteroidales bacterium]|jgi:prepilin-type N-terminal cleavage/methylation domain-containing protein|nr:prepilin-type N-terminal cleavage/methylation domain-containing protein [Bacteroidales bacterium]